MAKLNIFVNQSKELTQEAITEGLEIRPLSWFEVHPKNEIFDNLKTDAYWKALEKDIREAGKIIDPLICVPGGLIVEGHSRLTIAKKLNAEGVKGFEKLPVRIIELAPDEIEKRLYLGNLSRFEIDEVTRLALYAELWPGFFLTEKKPGQKAKGDTVSPLQESNPDTENPISATVALIQETSISDLEQATGKKKRQLYNDKKIIQEADKKAKKEGRTKAALKDIREVQAKINTERKAGKSKSDSTQKPSERMAGKGQPGYMSGNQRAGNGKENQLVTLKESLKIAHVCIDKLHGNKAAMKDAKKAVNDFMKGLLRYGI